VAQEEEQQPAAQPAPPPPVVIVKKVGGHGGHHGGAWKVAYADFVTAMMALFIVLWLLNSNQKVQEAVAGYFKDPKGYGKEVGSAQGGSGENMALARDDMAGLGEKLQKVMEQLPEFQKVKDQIQMTVTGEGLRVELLETEAGLFFESGSPQPSKYGQQLLAMLARELGKLPNNVLIEGHTDARPFLGRDSYGNWELSTERANSARRLMQKEGLQPNQVVQVRGFADQRLFKAGEPNHASNRRISVIIQYRTGAAKDAATEKSAEPKAAPKPH